MISKNALRALFMTALWLSLFSLGSCKKCDDPCNLECDNYDPCCNVKSADASFELLTKPLDPGLRELEIEALPLEENKVSRASILMGKAREGFSEYRWTLLTNGFVYKYEGREFEHKVDFYHNLSNITVKLSVNSEGASNCEKKESDQSEQAVQVLAFEKIPVFGQYRGNYEPPHNLEDDFIIEITKAEPRRPTDSLDYARHLNPFLVHIQCEKIDSWASINGFAFFSNYNHCCRRTEATGKLENKKDIIIKLNHQDTDPCTIDYDDPRAEKTFTGTKIP